MMDTQDIISVYFVHMTLSVPSLFLLTPVEHFFCILTYKKCRLPEFIYNWNFIILNQSLKILSVVFVQCIWTAADVAD